MKSLQIETSVIDHSEQNYRTLGNYFIENKFKKFFISDTGFDEYNTLILIHELYEELATRKLKIKEEDITAFDILFEEERVRGLHSEEDEPGNDLRAPYYVQHQEATLIEKLAAILLGVDWNEYEKKCVEIDKTWKKK